MNDCKTALILGATGGIGGEVAAQLLAAGWDGAGAPARSAARQQSQWYRMDHG